MQTWTCPSCNTTNEPAAPWCITCGGPAPAEPATEPVSQIPVVQSVRPQAPPPTAAPPPAAWPPNGPMAGHQVSGPVPTPAPAPAPEPSSSKRGWLVAAGILAVVVAVGIGALVGLSTREDDSADRTRSDGSGQGAGGADATTTTAAATTTAPVPGVTPGPTTTTGPTPTTTTAPATTMTARGPRQEPVATTSTSPAAAQAAATFGRYFAAINDKDWPTVRAQFTPEQQTTKTDANLAEGAGSSQDSDVVLVSLSPVTGGYDAAVTFTSRQDAADGFDGQTCSRWSITYRLVPSGGALLIGGVDADGDPAAC